MKKRFAVLLAVFVLIPSLVFGWTYRNDSTVTYSVTDINGASVKVNPGKSVQSYQDLTNLSGMTKTSDLPYYNINTMAPMNISLTAAAATKAISGITKASPGVITSSSHGLVNDDYCYLAVVGMTEINDRIYQVTKLDNDTFKLKTIDATGASIYVNTTGFGTFSSGTFRKVVPSSIPACSGSVTVNCFSPLTNTVQVVKTSYGAVVRLHYQSVNNKPHVCDTTLEYDWKQSGIKGYVNTVILTEIAGGSTPTCSVRQER